MNQHNENPATPQAARHDDGGSAFPRPISRDPESYRDPEIYCAQEGMTLRAYIAARALPAVIDVNRENMKISFEGEAEQAVRYADALIAALKAGAA